MKNDGGPAFPAQTVSYPGGAGRVDPGMSLRDYFAAQALANMRIHENSDNPHYWERVAKSAYAAADAMLSERAKGGAQ